MDFLFHSINIDVRIMNYDDILFICRADGDESQKNIAYLKRQLENQEKGECIALLALYNGTAAGYVFLYYQCRWGGLANCNIPCVVDLMVFEKYRRKKIASILLDIIEDIAKQHCNKIYLDVCLNSDYGPAQRFYIKRGYIPDGKGVYYEEKICETDAVCKNDDELTLCLVKELY
jgi:GNAT superfamily N-acetyltransferase